MHIWPKTVLPRPNRAKTTVRRVARPLLAGTLAALGTPLAILPLLNDAPHKGFLAGMAVVLLAGVIFTILAPRSP